MMRGLVAICVGLVVVLGAGVANAGPDITPGACCKCSCGDPMSGLELVACFQAEGDVVAQCQEICGEAPDWGFECTEKPVSCSDDPQCAAPATSAPAASPYGIAALLALLAGFGAYRLRKNRVV